MLTEIYKAIDPVAIQIGPVAIRWYGIAYVLGLFLAAFIIYKVAKRWQIRISEESLLVIVLCVIIGVIFGGRLGYCLFYGNGFYFRNPAEIFAFNQGGMSFHGGLIGALLSGAVASRFTRIPYLTLTDLGCIGAPLGLFFGRCANFINGELWGAPTDLPWGVVFGGAAGTMPRHPSQLYEAALEGLALFFILYLLSRKRPPFSRGMFTGVFLIGYAVFRILVEFVRIPDLQLGYILANWVTMGQLLSLPLLIVGLCLIAFAVIKKLPQEGESEAQSLS